jgi:signal transduction histidine kinase
VLLVVLLLFSALSYAALRWTLLRDVDSTLLVVAQVVRDTGYPRGPLTDPEAQLRDLLGPDFYDRFLRLLDPEGALEDEAPGTASRPFPLSREARANAQRGLPTFETLGAADGEGVRVLTMPVNRGGRLVNLIQVGIPLRRTREALDRYVRILLALVPLGLGLAMVGGALVARRALAPVGLMSRTARRITAQDLTERIPARGAGDELDHLAETLNAMLARLEAAFVEVRRFAADAAHELRTPLTALRGELEVGLRADRSPAEYRHVLESALESAERLVRLAEDLLALSRATAGGVARSGPVDVEALVLGALDAGVRLAQGRGVTVRLGAVASNAVQGDAVALERALLNLVDNAVRYTPAGGKVEISATPTDGWVEIVVALINHWRLPLGRMVPQPWPTLPDLPPPVGPQTRRQRVA